VFILKYFHSIKNRSNLVRGAGSVVDMWPDRSAQRAQYRAFGPARDAQALAGDFLRVGNDLRGAIAAHVNETK